MASQADVFDIDVVRAILKAAEPSVSAKNKFMAEWDASVKKRISTWKGKGADKTISIEQLGFEAQIVEYIDYLHKRLSVHGNSTKNPILVLSKGIPFLGPRFIPPTYTHVLRRHAVPTISPELAYLKPVTIVHPVFYPTVLTKVCPQCDSKNVLWEGWNTTGARDVYGVSVNERALGFQMRCKDCKENAGADETYCFATTNPTFWEKCMLWKIPKTIPIFSKRAAVTHDLFDLITELRLSTTSAGLAENIKQLHLLEYTRRKLDYILHFEIAPRNQLNKERPPFKTFSTPTDPGGYNDAPITSDFVSDMYLSFISNGRQQESTHYCKTRTAISISVDNTFKSASKATVVSRADRRRERPIKGGVLSALNEHNEGLAWRFCLSASPVELQELLSGIAKRLVCLDKPNAAVIIADNCCAVRRFIEEAFGKDILVCLDVFHFISRYGAVTHGGTKNPFHREVLASIKDAIVKTPAKNNMPATYWPKEDQEVRLCKAYEHWAQIEGVWSAAAPKTHSYQLGHVRKGCLSRPDNISHIPLDGSRIEGSHKGWNSLQRAQPSGIEMYTALGHDHFHRRNIRVSTSRTVGSKRGSINCPEFVSSLNGSHHIHLADYVARRSNLVNQREASASKVKCPSPAPVLPEVNSSETFGLVQSHHSKTFGGLVNAEEDSTLVEYDPLLDGSDNEAGEEAAAAHLSETIGINPDLISTLLQRSRNPDAKGKKRKEPDLPTAPVPAIASSAATDGCDTPDSKRRCLGVGPPLSPGSMPVAGSSKDVDTGGTPASKVSSGSPTPGPINCEPSGDIISRQVDVSAPPLRIGDQVMQAAFAFIPTPAGPSQLASETAVQPINVLQAHRQSEAREEDSAAGEIHHLRRPLPLPLNLKQKGLTRSQILFSIGTNIDPRALEIKGDDEFFLFMDMRKENQWASFTMTVDRWAGATKLYNIGLQTIKRQKGGVFVPKLPQALQSKLASIEDKITERLAKNNYLSATSNTETFWKAHCEAVPSLRVKAESWRSTDANGNLVIKKPRKPGVCNRCKSALLHHRKGCCSDGCPQRPKPGAIDMSLPDYPQPAGIFKDAQSFNPLGFLTVLHNLYERVIEYKSLSSNNTTSEAPSEFDSDTICEDHAFARMVQQRTRVINNHSYFLLYDGLDTVPTCTTDNSASLISEINGKRHLRMDCLHE